MSVPVLVISGPVGVGKTTVGRRVGHRLREAGVPHAVVDLEWLSASWPRPPDDPWNESVAHRNLASVWPNFRASGVDRLILCRVRQARSLLERVAEAVPGAEFTVVRLRAPVDVVHARIRGRQADADWYLNAASELVPAMERPELADYVVDTTSRTADQVAEEILGILGWVTA